MADNGIHHVTAIAGPARRNLDFYTRVLGLRLVKKTVNFDDPGTYHLYYGDGAGTPGTILTFFPWEHAAPGRAGIGDTATRPECSHRDHDGMRLALVGVRDPADDAMWSGGEIPAENAIRGFHGVTLLLREAAPTAAILTDVLGFAEEGREGSIVRYRAGGTSVGGVVDIQAVGDFLRGRQGAGSVHHIAFRAADDAAEFAMMQKLAENHGIQTTEQKDRNYFRSLYFREPGGVLFEIATDIPGFAVDEPVAELGQSLKLPPQYEARRVAIEAALPDLSA